MTPNTPMRLAPNTICLFYGQTLRVVERHNQSQVIEFQKEGDGEKFFFSDAELWHAWHSRDFQIVNNQPLRPIPLDQEGPNRVNPKINSPSSRAMADAQFYQPYMEAWAQLEDGYFILDGEALPASKSASTRMRVAKAVADQHRHGKVPAYSTLGRHYSKYRINRDFRQLESKHENKGNTSARFLLEVEDIIQETIKENHLNPKPQNFTKLTEVIRGRVERHFVAKGMSPDVAIALAPSIPTVTQRVRQIPAIIRTRSQFGYVKAHQDHHVFGTTDPAMFPLQFVEADHTGVPTIAIDPVHYLVLGPTRLTLLLDRFSTCVLGAHIYFDHSSYDAISIGLKDTLLPKEDAADRFEVDLRHTWNQFGVPHRLCIDGGRDFAGHDLSEACHRLGISIVDLPRKSGWFKGTIENFFKTLKTHMAQTYPGTPSYNLIKKLQLPDPEKYDKYAVMTLDDLKRALVKWVVDIYHQEPHPRLPKTRQQVWDEGIAMGTVPPPDPGFIQVAMGRTNYATLQHYGVQFNRLKYQSAELGKIRSYLEGGKPAKVKFVYYPEDCTRIDVQHPVTDEMIPAFAHMGAVLEGMSHWQWDVLRRQFGAERTENIDRDELAASRREIEAMVADIMTRKSATGRRKAAAFLDSAQQFGSLPGPNQGQQDAAPLHGDQAATPAPPLSQMPLQDDPGVDTDDDSDEWGGDYDNPRTWDQ